MLLINDNKTDYLDLTLVAKYMIVVLFCLILKRFSHFSGYLIIDQLN